MRSRHLPPTPFRLQLAMLVMSANVALTLLWIGIDLANGEAGVYRILGSATERMAPPIWPYAYAGMTLAQAIAVYFAFRHRCFRVVVATTVLLAVLGFVDGASTGSWSGFAFDLVVVGLIVSSRRVFIDRAPALQVRARATD